MSRGLGDVYKRQVVVTIGVRFGGKDLIVDISKPDKTPMAIVLGIGVADNSN